METLNNWVKTLVRQEEQMEKTGKIAAANPFCPSKEELQEHTVEFLKQLRTAFTQHISFFNQLKGYMGSIRIYGITGTLADFMLFRNGYKMIFFYEISGMDCQYVFPIWTLYSLDKRSKTALQTILKESGGLSEN